VEGIVHREELSLHTFKIRKTPVTGLVQGGTSFEKIMEVGIGLPEHF
jgi:hypothetical protein